MDQKQSPSKSEAQILVRPFEWHDWYDMWKLRGYQLAEAGILVDGIQGPPDFSIPYDEENPDYHEIDMDRIDEAYLKGRGNFWIAWLDDQPLGHVGAQDFKDFIELRRMYVREEFRQRGIGTLLVSALIKHCIEKKVSMIELWTDPEGLGHLLYEKLGFQIIEPIGAEPEFAKRGQTEMRMRLVLRSV